MVVAPPIILQILIRILLTFHYVQSNALHCQ